MYFKDLTDIIVRSGKGGAGLVSFKSAYNKPKLGADGGDGGFGGNVYFIGDAQLNSLSVLRYNQEYKAEDGSKGGPNGRTGKNGKDLLIPVPLGTIAINSQTSQIIGEVTDQGEKLLLAKGGKRGLGNMRYVSPTHQAPEEHTLGGEEEEIYVHVELKLIADIGFAGFPNAGKSTLLSRISAAKPKIADYPFTTLHPNLGVVELPNSYGFGKSYVAADIPGLIEGASDGKGLGFQFLRHLERTSIIAYVIDAFSLENADIITAYNKLKYELTKYSDKFLLKPSVIVLTKADLAYNDEIREEILLKAQSLKEKVFMISAVSGKGLEEFNCYIYNLLQDLKNNQEEAMNLDDDDANENTDKKSNSKNKLDNLDNSDIKKIELIDDFKVIKKI